MVCLGSHHSRVPSARLVLGSLSRRAIAIEEAVYGPRHPETAVTINNLAQSLKMMGLFNEAEEKHRVALGIFEETLGRDHAETVTTLHNLAFVLKERGKLSEAEDYFRRTLTITEGRYGEMHSETAISK